MDTFAISTLYYAHKCYKEGVRFSVKETAVSIVSMAIANCSFHPMQKQDWVSVWQPSQRERPHLCPAIPHWGVLTRKCNYFKFCQFCGYFVPVQLYENVQYEKGAVTPTPLNQLSLVDKQIVLNCMNDILRIDMN